MTSVEKKVVWLSVVGLLLNFALNLGLLFNSELLLDEYVVDAKNDVLSVDMRSFSGQGVYDEEVYFVNKSIKSIVEKGYLSISLEEVENNLSYDVDKGVFLIKNSAGVVDFFARRNLNLETPNCKQQISPATDEYQLKYFYFVDLTTYCEDLDGFVAIRSDLSVKSHIGFINSFVKTESFRYIYDEDNKVTLFGGIEKINE